jgi:transposase InsO family protein
MYGVGCIHVAAIQVDNGPEFTSRVVDQWAYQNQVALHFIERGKPTQNAFIKSFNGNSGTNAEPELVRKSVARTGGDRSLAGRLQYRASAQLAGVSNGEFAASVAARPRLPLCRSPPSPQREKVRLCRSPEVLT